jgi:ketosteroid isomerase-like protein
MNRRSLIAGLAAGLAGGRALAQAPTSGPDEAVQRAIAALRERVRAAVAAKDRGALERAYADRFFHMRDTGRMDLKAERIALLLTGEATIETGAEEEIAVQRLAPDTAVATGVTAIPDPATPGRPARFRWLTVYVREGEAWRIAASQASRIAVRRR